MCPHPVISLQLLPCVFSQNLNDYYFLPLVDRCSEDGQESGQSEQRRVAKPALSILKFKKENHNVSD